MNDGCPTKLLNASNFGFDCRDFLGCCQNLKVGFKEGGFARGQRGYPSVCIFHCARVGEIHTWLQPRHITIFQALGALPECEARKLPRIKPQGHPLVTSQVPEQDDGAMVGPNVQVHEVALLRKTGLRSTKAVKMLNPLDRPGIARAEFPDGRQEP